MTSLSELQQRFLNIATDGRLSPKQKSNFLALEAEACIPYMPISEALREAMSDGVICDMFEVMRLLNRVTFYLTMLSFYLKALNIWSCHLQKILMMR